MSKESYFAQYVSPNIVIVPTVSFCPPSVENKPDTILYNKRLLNDDHRIGNNTSVPAASTSNKHNSKEGEVNTNLSIIGSTGNSDHAKILPITKHTVSTEDAANHMSLRMKEMSSSKYKSRNNLVDLTGFNILKRDCITSSTKLKDPKQNAESKIDPNKTMDKKENLKHVDSANSQKENKPNKELKTKNSLEKPQNRSSDDNAKDSAIRRPKENTVDMEEKMEKYFKLLWKRNLEKLKVKSAKDNKRDRYIKKSSTTEQSCKDLNREPCKTKAKLQKVSKSSPTKSSKNKLKDQVSAKENHDCDRKIVREYSSRSKNETKSYHSTDTKKSTKDREQFLSPVSIKRFKDFQRFIHHNDDVTNNDHIKREIGKVIKTEKSHDKKHLLKSSKPLNISSEPKKKVLERKESVNNSQNSKVNSNLDKKGKVHLIKSVVKINRNSNNDNSHSKCTNDKQDLRSKLSRKRTRNECFTRSQQILKSKLDQENLVVTVKQDVNTDPKILAKFAPNVNKSKTKKCKKIKLVINIECPNSDSDSDQNVNECCSSPQDLSFLDDFNIDEIVDSLRTSHSQTENNQINESEVSHQINKLNVNDMKDKTKETRPKEMLINDLNKKVIKIKKEETNNCGEHVILINSDTENEKFEIGTLTDTRKNKDGFKIKTNTETAKNIKQEASNVSELPKKYFKNNMQADLMDLCNGNDGSVQDIKCALYKNNNNKISKGTQETEQTWELSKKFDIPNVPTTNKEKRLKTANRKSLKIGNKNTSRTANNLKKKTITALSKTNTNKKADLTPENSTKSSFITEKETCKKIIVKNIDSLKNTPHINDTKTVINTKTSVDPIEISLETLFNNIDKETTNNLDIKQTRSDKHTQEEKILFQNSVSSVEASLESMFYDVNQECNMNVNTAVNQYIKTEPEPPQNGQDAIDALQVTSNETSNTNKIQIKLSNEPDKHITKKPECSHKSVYPIEILQKTIESNIDLKANVKLDKRQSEIVKNIKLKSKCLPNAKDANKKLHDSRVNITEMKEDIKMGSVPFRENIKGEVQKCSRNIKNKIISTAEIIKKNEEKKSDGQKDKISVNQSDKTTQEKAENMRNPRVLTDVSDKHVKIPIKPSRTLDRSIKKQPSNCLLTAEITTKKPVEAVKNIEEQIVDQINTRSLTRSDENMKEINKHLQSSKPIESHEATVHDTDIKNHMKPMNAFDKHLIETPGHLQVSKDTFKEFRVPKTYINIKKTVIHKDTQNDIVTSDKKYEERAKEVLKSTATLKTVIETPTHNIKNKSTIIDDTNDNEKVVESENTTKINSEGTNNNVEKTNVQHIKIDVDSSIIDKHIEEKTQKNTQGATDKPLNARNENLIHSSSANIELLRNVRTNVEVDSSSKECANKIENFLPANTDPDTEFKQIKSPEIVTNNVQKSGTTVDGPSKTKDCSKNTKRDSETNKLAEKNVETSTKPEPGNRHEDMFSDGIENNDQTIQKDETKSKQFEVKLPQSVKPFTEKLESRMLQYLKKKYTVTSLLHNGNFSIIYKCRDTKGENYAVKAYNAHNKGVFIERILSQLRKCRIEGNSSLLYIINGFGVQGRWCLLTEYYPQNLKEALEKNKKSFHIDLVQMLSRQLVDAVNMLTNNNIIHSDIKPSHILLNSEMDRLKLTGFDRANHSDRIKIIPSTGTPSYRAPEIILGFAEDHKIDVWSTALIMFEMATNTKLFPGLYNNDILYKQLCTLGSFDWDMVEQSRFKNLYFFGTSFLRQVGPNGKKTVLVHVIHRNKKLRNLFLSYDEDWSHSRTRWQSTEDLDKLETLHTLLEQMLAMDPRYRLPIQFVSASDFIHDVTT